MFEEKLDKVIRALEQHEGAEGREVSCEGCPYEEYAEYCLTVLHKDALAVIKDLQEKLKTAKDGRLELARRCRERSSGDLISRSALLAELSRRLSIVDMLGVAEIVNAVDAVEAEPVVHAHWEQHVDEDEDWGDMSYFKCSACGTVELTGRKRCPECGAHMDEEVSDGE